MVHKTQNDHFIIFYFFFLLIYYFKFLELKFMTNKNFFFFLHCNFGRFITNFVNLLIFEKFYLPNQEKSMSIKAS